MFPLKDTNPSRSAPVVTLLIIFLCVFVFVFELSLGRDGLDDFLHSYAVIPERYLQHWGLDQAATVFSSMFLHAGWVHLTSNMWYLHVFGDNVEDRMGHFRFLIFYLVCGAAAAVLQVMFAPDSSLPMVGASGAIAGVLGAYLVLFPEARIITFIPIFLIPYFVEIPALFYLGFWFVMQFFTGIFSLGVSQHVGADGGVAWWAHVGGFVTGIVLVKIFTAGRVYHEWYPDEYQPW